MLCEARQEFRLWLVRDPSKAACRAMLLGQSSRDQRVKGLAFSREAVRSGLRSLPGPVVVVKHAVRFARCSSPCGSAAVGDQGGLREQTQARLGSSTAGGHTGHGHTRAPISPTSPTVCSSHPDDDFFVQEIDHFLQSDDDMEETANEGHAGRQLIDSLALPSMQRFKCRKVSLFKLDLVACTDADSYANANSDAFHAVHPPRSEANRCMIFNV